MKRSVSVIVIVSLLVTLATPLSATRYYDSAIGRWLVPDKAGQYWSPYVYCGNNPLAYVDENGDLAWFIPVIIGATFGGYSGYKIGEARGAEGWGMFGYVLGGATIGGATGYMGHSIAAAGGAFSQTGAIAASSYANSLGMTMLSGGMTDVSVSFGVGSYNFGTGEFGYLGEKGNSGWENLGYGFGAMANLSDIVAWNNGTKVDVIAEKDKSMISHSSIVNRDEGIAVSVGPDVGFNPKDPISWVELQKGEYWTHLYDAKGQGFGIQLPNVNRSILQSITSNIKAGQDMFGNSLKWNVFPGFSCASHAARALWAVGVPNLGGWHPYILELQIIARELGIHSSAYLINQY